MLSEMNRAIQKYPMVIGGTLVVMIAIPFIFMSDGVEDIFRNNPRQQTADDVIAKVDNKEITLREYEQLKKDFSLGAFLDYNESYLYKNSRSSSQKEAVLLRAKIAESLKDQEVTAPEMKEYFASAKGIQNLREQGLKTNKEIIRYIQGQLGIYGKDFDRVLKENILIKKNEETLKSKQLISDEEVKNKVIADNKTFEVLTKEFSTDAAGDKIVLDYYNTNKDEFTFADARQASIVAIYPSSYLKKGVDSKAANLLAREAATKASNALKAAKTSKAFSAIATKLKLQVETSDFVTAKSIKDDSNFLEKKLSEKIYTLTSEAPFASTIKGDNAYYIAYLNKLGKTETLQEARETILEKLYGEKEAAYYENHKETHYVIPAKLKTSAYVVRHADFPVQKVTATEVKDAYEKTKDQYKKDQVNIISLSVDKPKVAKLSMTLEKLLSSTAKTLAKATPAQIATTTATLKKQNITVSQSSWQTVTDLGNQSQAVLKDIKKGQASPTFTESNKLKTILVLDRRSEIPFTELAVEIENDLVLAKQAPLVSARINTFAKEIAKLSTKDNEQYTTAVTEAAKRNKVTKLSFKEVPKASPFGYFNQFNQYGLNITGYSVFRTLGLLSESNRTTGLVALSDGAMIVVTEKEIPKTYNAMNRVHRQTLNSLLEEAAKEAAQKTAAAFYDKNMNGDWTKLGFVKSQDKKEKKIADLDESLQKIITGKDFKLKTLYSYDTDKGSTLAVVNKETLPTDKAITAKLEEAKKVLLADKQNKALVDFHAKIQATVTITQNKETLAKDEK